MKSYYLQNLDIQIPKTSSIILDTRDSY